MNTWDVPAGATDFIDEDRLIAASVADKSPRTQEIYGRRMRAFKKWCDDHGIGLLEVTPTDARRYFQTHEGSHLSASSLYGIHIALRNLYRFAVKRGVIDVSPMTAVVPPRVTLAKPVVLSKEEFSLVLDAAKRLGPKETAVVTLMGVNGLKPTEITEGRIEDLERRDGFWTLKLPSRGDSAYTVLPELTSVPLLAQMEGRERGPLILDQHKAAMNRHSLHWIAARVGRKADISGVTTRVLRNTMVALAVQVTGDLYGVQEAAGYDDLRQLGRIAIIDADSSGHVAVRLARALERSVETDDVLEQAERLLLDADVHPIAPIVLAAATLEARLRATCLHHGLTVDHRSSLDRYATALKGARLLSSKDFRRIQKLGDIRNDAAHGLNLADLTVAVATDMVSEVRLLFQRLPSFT